MSSSSSTGVVQQQEQFIKSIDSSNSQTASSQIDSSRDSQQYVLKDLTPGATYQLQLFTVYDNKESVAYISKNFTTSKFYIWY